MTNSQLFSPTFVIGTIRIGSVENASCINMGNNYPTGFQNHLKHNQGFGNVGGDHNQLTGTRAVLDDADFLESFGEAKSEIPDWLQRLIQEHATQAMNG